MSYHIYVDWRLCIHVWPQRFCALALLLQQRKKIMRLCRITASRIMILKLRDHVKKSHLIPVKLISYCCYGTQRSDLTLTKQSDASHYSITYNSYNNFINHTNCVMPMYCPNQRPEVVRAALIIIMYTSTRQTGP